MRLSAFHFLSCFFVGWAERSEAHAEFGTAERVGTALRAFAHPTKKAKRNAHTETKDPPLVSRCARPSRPVTVASKQKLAARERERAPSSSTAIAGEVAAQSAEVGATMVQNDNGDSCRRSASQGNASSFARHVIARASHCEPVIGPRCLAGAITFRVTRRNQLRMEPANAHPVRIPLQTRSRTRKLCLTWSLAPGLPLTSGGGGALVGRECRGR
jgi:hypothetical protein